MMINQLPRLPITGSKVIVRCLQAEDLGEMYCMESDPDVKRYLNGPVSAPRDEWIRGVKSKLDQWDFAILAKDTGEFAGRAALHAYHDVGAATRSIEVVIRKKYQDRYFGREACKILIAAAFNELGVERVIGVVHPENEKSLKLLRYFGFDKAGVVKRYSKGLPSQIDHLKFVLSRSAYESRVQDACQPIETN